MAGKSSKSSSKGGIVNKREETMKKRMESTGAADAMPSKQAARDKKKSK